ncbi:hypothetical protein BDZ45DRAFT_437124 [Acephala macrosclerotiorum]|nr:hypothetical protein BDZ45DRAFT_437124 [Acephala macrosclerotiorum]
MSRAFAEPCASKIVALPASAYFDGRTCGGLRHLIDGCCEDHKIATCSYLSCTHCIIYTHRQDLCSPRVSTRSDLAATARYIFNFSGTQLNNGNSANGSAGMLVRRPHSLRCSAVNSFAHLKFNSPDSSTSSLCVEDQESTKEANLSLISHPHTQPSSSYY